MPASEMESQQLKLAERRRETEAQAADLGAFSGTTGPELARKTS